MDYKKLSLGLGVFSLALGAVELLRAKRIAEALDAPDRDGLVKAFGAREIVAGLGIVAAPATSAMIWNRVAGDAMDAAALGAAAYRNPQNRAVWGALAFVAAAAVLDLVTALGLDRQTGKFWPVRTARAA